jgi:hypothetical protein
MKSGALLARTITPYVVSWRVMVGLFRQYGGGRGDKACGRGGGLVELRKWPKRHVSGIPSWFASHTG